MMRLTGIFVCAMLFCLSCSEEDWEERRLVTGFVGVGDEIAMNDTLYLRYGIFVPDSAEVSFYLCGPLKPNDESLWYATYNVKTDCLDKLYARTNARRINDHCVFVQARYGHYDWYWIPTPELVEEGKIYLLVVDIRFLDAERCYDSNALYDLLVLPPRDDEAPDRENERVE